jgi:2-amino-4-hydroxy-6-hydroxymethyldihydropteridine diphosphokinase
VKPSGDRTARRASSTRFAYVALGANLGSATQTLRQAFDRLAGLSTEPLRRSSLWETTPVDCPPGSPTFVNAVARLTPRLSETAESFLAKLQELERQFGRRPKAVLNEPRPLDLDLIDFRNELRRTPDLVLPHPRAHLRRFVLAPLAEIEPDLVLPGQQLTVGMLLHTLRCDAQVCRLDAI